MIRIIIIIIALLGSGSYVGFYAGHMVGVNETETNQDVAVKQYLQDTNDLLARLR